ncbi:acyltransferase [Paenibacillus sp. FSL R7-0313]|uniref:acyltransferase family protein n=1 Tax=Paenibacillus sp. FSL R7-0313 TaxID=2954532 RepID=UPI0030DA8285
MGLANIDNKRLNRLDEIEVLRGIAASAIVLYHMWALGGFQGVIPLVDQISNYLGIGVPLFFAISAFSLLYGYSTKIFDEQSLKKFYVRRYFRLAPLFYVMLVVYLIEAFYVWGAKYSLSNIILNMTFMFQLVPSQHQSIVWAGWSLGIEWVFYLCFPLVVLTTRSKKLLITVFVAFLMISVGYSSLTAAVVQADSSLDYMSIMKHFVYFLLGALVFICRPYLENIKDKYAWLKHLDIIILVASVTLFVILERHIPKDIVSCLLFFTLMSSAYIGFSKLLNNPFTRLLGRTSYGLYLLNPIAIVLLQRMGLYEFIGSLMPNSAIWFLVSSVISFLVIVVGSVLAYYLIEQPGIRLGQRLLDKKKTTREG